MSAPAPARSTQLARDVEVPLRRVRVLARLAAFWHLNYHNTRGGASSDVEHQEGLDLLLTDLDAATVALAEIVRRDGA